MSRRQRFGVIPRLTAPHRTTSSEANGLGRSNRITSSGDRMSSRWTSRLSRSLVLGLVLLLLLPAGAAFAQEAGDPSPPGPAPGEENGDAEDALGVSPAELYAGYEVPVILYVWAPERGFGEEVTARIEGHGTLEVLYRSTGNLELSLAEQLPLGRHALVVEDELGEQRTHLDVVEEPIHRYVVTVPDYLRTGFAPGQVMSLVSPYWNEPTSFEQGTTTVRLRDYDELDIHIPADEVTVIDTDELRFTLDRTLPAGYYQVEAITGRERAQSGFEVGDPYLWSSPEVVDSDHEVPLWMHLQGRGVDLRGAEIAVIDSADQPVAVSPMDVYSSGRYASFRVQEQLGVGAYTVRVTAGEETLTSELEVRRAPVDLAGTGPLTKVSVGQDLSCIVARQAWVFQREACGTYVHLDGVTYGPGSGWFGFEPFTEVGQTERQGQGTSEDPYWVETVVALGDTGVTITQVDTYVNGEESFDTSVTVDHGGAQAQEVIVYRAAECGYSRSTGHLDPGTGEVGCLQVIDDDDAYNQNGGTVLLAPTTAGSSGIVDRAGVVFDEMHDGEVFGDTCLCDEELWAGLGLSWAVDESATVGLTTSVTELYQSATLSVSPSWLVPGYEGEQTVNVYAPEPFFNASATVSIVDEDSGEPAGDLVRAVTVSSPTHLSFSLAEGLASGRYSVLVTTDDGTRRGRLSVEVPPAYAYATPYALPVGYDAAEMVVTGVRTSFADAETTITLRRDDLTSVPGAVSDLVVDSATALSFTLAEGLPEGQYHLVITTGEERVLAWFEVRVPRVHVGDLYDDEELPYWAWASIYPFDFSSSDLAITLHDEHGQAIPDAIGAIRGFGDWIEFEILVELELGEHQLTFTSGNHVLEATLRMRERPPYIWIDPWRLPVGYEAQTITVHGDRTSFSEETEVTIRPDWQGTVPPGVVSAVEVVSDSLLTFELAEGLDANDYLVEVRTGAQEVVGWFEVVEPAAYVWPEVLDPADLADRVVLYANLHAFDERTTLHLERDGTPVDAAIQDLRIDWPDHLSFRLGEVLPPGIYDVVAVTGDERLSGSFEMLAPSPCSLDLGAVSASGLANMGFEDGLEGWTRGRASDGGVVVTGGDGHAQPWRGEHMARLGTATGGDYVPHPRNELCQDFVVDEPTESFAYNVFTRIWDGTSQLRWTVSDPDTGAVILSGRPRGAGFGHELKSTGWRVVELDLSAHVGQTLRLTFTRGNGYEDAPAWVYLDSAEGEPPAEPAPIADVEADGNSSSYVDPETGETTIAMPVGTPAPVTITSTLTCPDGGQILSAALYLDATRYEMTNVDGNRWRATIPAENVQNGRLSTRLECEGAATPTVTDVGKIVLYDPSGDVYDAATNQLLTGATVHLYKVTGWMPDVSDDDGNLVEERQCRTPDTRTGSTWTQPAPTELGVLVPASSNEISPNVNPQLTNGNGRYGWDVAEGCWYVVVSKDGYQTVTSPVVGVPPEVLDLDIRLTPVTAPDTTPPAWPTGASLTATPAATSVSLSWPAATDDSGIAEYRISRDGTPIGTRTTRSFTDTGLTPETTYTYSVVAVDASANRNESTPLTTQATTTASDEDAGPGTGQPGTGQPGTGQPGTGEPGTDEPGTDEPGTDEPGDATPTEPAPGVPDGGGPGAGDPGAGQPAPPTDPAAPVLERLSGAERAATAVAVSQSVFSAGVPVVYIATQGDFPDALAGGPLAAKEGGPVLLVSSGDIPAVTAEELRRLQPGRIVVLGGSGVITNEVVEALRAFTAGTVTRLSGQDRFETAARVSAESFEPGVAAVYLATGLNFPDALTGGAAAALDEGPILLTLRDSVPAATAAELARLRPQRIYVLGGSGVVSDEVVAAVQQHTDGQVIRLAGEDRFATAAQISSQRFTAPVEVVYVATGGNFPDALAGVPAAGVSGAPMLLVARDSIPAVVQEELMRLRPRRIVVLGGEGAVSAGVLSELDSYRRR
jgi:putative cell wall-binding protein